MSEITMSVAEIIRFYKGQEIQELLSVELEPNIVVSERGDIISITGNLELSGVYVPDHVKVEYEERSLREITGIRAVEQIVERDDGVNEFHHRFPVDVSVPTYKVADINDVDVRVYNIQTEIQDDNSLKIIATVGIQGVTQESRIQELFELEDEPDFPEELETQDAAIDPYERPAYWEADVVKNEEEVVGHPVADQQPIQPVWEEHAYQHENGEDPVDAQPTVPAFSLHDVQEQQRITPPVFTPFEIEVKKEVPKPEHTAPTFVAPNYPTITAYPPYNKEEEVIGVTRLQKALAKPAVSAVEEKVEQAPSKPSILSTIFAKEQREGEYSKLKMVSVQKGDSLESIALRYKVLPSAIQKVNGLATENVREGQFIYIPVKQ